jgi:hypothetical protein
MLVTEPGSSSSRCSPTEDDRMSLPGLPLPTDSLYKFLALAGLTLAIVSVAVPFGLLLSNQNEMTALSVEIAGVRADIASADEALAILPTSPNDQVRTRELLDLSGKLRRRLAELQPKLDAIHRLNRRANDLTWLAFGARLSASFSPASASGCGGPVSNSTWMTPNGASRVIGRRERRRRGDDPLRCLGVDTDPATAHGGAGWLLVPPRAAAHDGWQAALHRSRHRPVARPRGPLPRGAARGRRRHCGADSRREGVPRCPVSQPATSLGGAGGVGRDDGMDRRRGFPRGNLRRVAPAPLIRKKGR